MVTLTKRQDLELRTLRLAFLAQLPERVQAIEAALADAFPADGARRERLEALFHLAHRLCGAAGIYGHEAAHAAAGALECAAEVLQRPDAQPPSARQVADLRRRVEALKRASQDVPTAPDTTPKGPARPRRRSPLRARRGASR